MVKELNSLFALLVKLAWLTGQLYIRRGISYNGVFESHQRSYYCGLPGSGAIEVGCGRQHGREARTGVATRSHNEVRMEKHKNAKI